MSRGRKTEVRGSRELRASGRRVEGLALPFGETCEADRCGTRERFERDAFDLEGLSWLDYEHDRERILAHTGDGSLELRATDRGLELTTRDLPELPLCDRVLEEIRAGRIRGLSVEFRSLRERREAGVRIVERAALEGVAVVRDPAYRETSVEVRDERPSRMHVAGRGLPSWAL